MSACRSTVQRGLAAATAALLGSAGLWIGSSGTAHATTSPLVPVCANGACTLSASYTGAEQTWTSPATMSVTATVVGGGAATGPNGGRAAGTVPVSAGDVLGFVVGGTATTVGGAYPDGGDGGRNFYGMYGEGGGGGSYLFDQHAAELVAGGAGGAGPDHLGGAGGSPQGNRGDGVTAGSGWTGGEPGDWASGTCVHNPNDGVATGADNVSGGPGGGPNGTDSTPFTPGGSGFLASGNDTASWHFGGGGGGGGGYCTGGGGADAPQPSDGGGGSGASYAAANVGTPTFNTAPTTTGSIQLSFADPVSLSPANMPNAVVGQAYSVPLTTSDSGSVSPSSIGVASSNWDGLTYSGGTLNGTPAAPGTFSYSVTVTEPSGITDTWTRSVYVQQSPSFTTASSTSSTEGSAASFTISTTATPTAAITETGQLPPGMSLTDNGDGTAKISGTPTSVGTYAVVLKASNGVSPDAAQSFTYTVNPVPTGTTLQAPTQSVYGQSVTLTANVSPAVAGTVTFLDGTTVLSTDLTDGSGTATSGPLSGLSVGTHRLTASFTPTDQVNNTGSTSAVTTLTVSKIATATTLQAPSSAYVAQAVTITASETPVVPGTMTFRDGSTVLATVATDGLGNASSGSLTNLSAGSHALTATFTPTDSTDDAGSTSASTTLTVSKYPTAVVLGAMPVGVAQGDPGPRVSATASQAGTVEFTVDGRNVGTTVAVARGAVVASAPLSGLGVGNHSVAASFSPTDAAAYSPSQAPPKTLVVHAPLTSRAVRWTVIGGRTSSLELHASGGYGSYRFTLLRVGTTLPHTTLTSAGRLMSAVPIYGTSPLYFKVRYRVNDGSGHSVVTSSTVTVELVIPGSWMTWGRPATPSPRPGTVARLSGLAATAAGRAHNLSFTFQWYLNHHAVRGATASTFRIPGNAVGDVVTLSVRASRAGYAPTSHGYYFGTVPSYPPSADFDRSYLVKTSGWVISDFNTVESRIGPGDGIDVEGALINLSYDFGYLEHAGYPGGRLSAADYYALVSTLSNFSSQAADAWTSGNTCTGAADYAVIKEHATDLFNDINSKIGTSFAVPKPGEDLSYWC